MYRCNLNLDQGGLYMPLRNLLHLEMVLFSLSICGNRKKNCMVFANAKLKSRSTRLNNTPTLPRRQTQQLRMSSLVIFDFFTCETKAN